MFAVLEKTNFHFTRFNENLKAAMTFAMEVLRIVRSMVGEMRLRYKEYVDPTLSEKYLKFHLMLGNINCTPVANCGRGHFL